MRNAPLYEVHRVLKAPVNRVWNAWTDADQLASWYGPVGFTSPRDSVKVDPVVGGFWSATVVVPIDGSAHHFFGYFTDVEENSFLTYTMFYATDETLEEVRKEEGPYHTVQLNFDDLGQETRLSFAQFGELPAEQIPMTKAGMESYFDSLASFIE